MKNRLIALLTTGMMLTSAAALPAVPVAAAEDPVIGTLPDWVPQDFAEALQFYNEYGKSHVEDNIICLVRPMRTWEKDSMNLLYSGTMMQINTPAGSEPQYYELEIPEKPDKEDPEAYQAYQDYCDMLGLPSYDYSFFEAYAGCRTQYAFEVELFHVLEGFDLTVTWTTKHDDDNLPLESFSFENKDGTTVETDIYSWLPDSMPEFNRFLTEYGRASVHENYIAYCADVNRTAGEELRVWQSGDCAASLVRESDCTPFYLAAVDGMSSPSVQLYQATAEGVIRIRWEVGREFSEEEPFETTDGLYESLYEGKEIVDRSPGRKGKTIFQLVDRDTNEPVAVPYGNCYLQRDSRQEPYTGEIYEITSNPFTVDSLTAFDPECSYSVNMGNSAGRYSDPEFEVTEESSYCRKVTCSLKWNASGDADGNGQFGLTDMILFQKWLLGIKNAELANPMAVDLYRDGTPDVFDLAMMKRSLLMQPEPNYQEPDQRLTYGTPMYVAVDDLPLYAAPDADSKLLGKIKQSSRLREIGYMNELYNWVFTEYNGIYGWIPLETEEGTPTVYFEAVADKPVIYLYPEQETDVHVELELTESELSTTYPKYRNGWDVTASPDGTLLNKADGTHHKYLFWDSVNCRTRYDFSKGFCVAGSDTEQFLKEKLTEMGLTENERNEFIVYWLPRMEHNAFNLITFQGDAYTNAARLHITPAPDSLCRIFMVYVPLEQAVEIEPQELSTFERKGFTVVEWGGSEIKS